MNNVCEWLFLCWNSLQLRKESNMLQISHLAGCLNGPCTQKIYFGMLKNWTWRLHKYSFIYKIYSFTPQIAKFLSFLKLWNPQVFLGTNFSWKTLLKTNHICYCDCKVKWCRLLQKFQMYKVCLAAILTVSLMLSHPNHNHKYNPNKK